MLLLVVCIAAVAVVAMTDFGEEHAQESAIRFRKYLTDSSSGPHIIQQFSPGSLMARRTEKLEDIGKPTSFKLRMHPWTDGNIVHARLIWSQMQDFMSRCGGQYSEDWCLSIVEFIENGVGYRELQLAIMGVQSRHETPIEHLEDNAERNDNETPQQTFQRALKKYIRLGRNQD